MSDYIKREDALDLIRLFCKLGQADPAIFHVFQLIIPADVIERRRGVWDTEWFDHKNLPVCSNCGCFAERMTDFCPNCGAEMRNPTYTLSTESGTFSFRNTKGGDT